MATVTTQFHVMSLKREVSTHEVSNAGDIALGVAAHVNNSNSIDTVSKWPGTWGL